MKEWQSKIEGGMETVRALTNCIRMPEAPDHPTQH